MEYFFLHRCIRNTSSDAEDLRNYQLIADRSTWPPERNIWIHEELNRTKEGREKRGRVRGTRPAPGGIGGTEVGMRSPHWGNSLGQRGGSRRC